MGEHLFDLVDRGGLLFADDDLDGARDAFETAFVELRDAGRLNAAVRVACALAQLHGSLMGNHAVGRGWIERARRLVDEIGPCVEEGYLDLALAACDRPDIADLDAASAHALTLARQYGDADLETRALADRAVALVTAGRTHEGLVHFDEVLAILSSGEVRDVQMIGTALCSLLTCCDRTGDLERATESMRLAEALLLRPLDGRPRVLGTHCQLALGSVLCQSGRWDDGEAALLDALGSEASASRSHRVQSAARLAELRVDQGRVDEAADLLADLDDETEVAAPLAMVHLRRGDPDLAAAVLRNAIKKMVGDVLRASRLLSLLVDAELTRGDLDAAKDAALLLESMAKAVDTVLVSGLAHAATGRLAEANGDLAGAVTALEAASDHLAGAHPLFVVRVHLDLSRAHASKGESPEAIVSARAAHAAARRVGAPALADEAAATLRDLGVTPPRPARTADALGGLTSRELDVLAGVQRGETNPQIAASLHLAPKTVEHHVSRILTKLGARTRAEAAAIAAGASH